MSNAEKPTGQPIEGLLDERYGRRKQHGIDRRIAWIAGGALAALGLLVVFFGGWQTTSTIEYANLAYEVVDDRTVRVDAQITAPPGSQPVCALQALSTSRATVGWKIVELGSSDERTRRFETTLVTASPATTGSVRECWLQEIQG